MAQSLLRKMRNEIDTETKGVFLHLSKHRCFFLQGMLKSQGDVVVSTKILMSLWKHECYRVIADRFTTQDDKDWFEKTIKLVSPGFSLYSMPEPENNPLFRRCNCVLWSMPLTVFFSL